MADTESLKKGTEEWVMARKNRNHGLLPLKEALNACGNPQNDVEIVHITGTNGKGSTLNYLKDILMAHGFTVGTFTSPHLVAHRDRIRINDKWIPEDVFAGYIRECMPLIEKYELGMFETDLLVALLYMQKEKPDYFLVEAGIGGRLDSTNVIPHARMEIITSVALDHTQILGGTIEQIAFEKAGIIRRRSTAVIGHLDPEAELIVRMHAYVRQANVIRTPDYRSTGRNTMHAYCDDYMISSAAEYQKHNACTAITAAWVLGIDIHDEKTKRAVKDSLWAGRFETAGTDPVILLDGAHNEEGMRALCTSLHNVPQPVYAVFSALKDKQVRVMAELLQAHCRELWITRFSNARMDTSENMHALPGTYEENWKNAVRKALVKADGKGTVLITGSLYFISEVRKSFLRGDFQRQKKTRKKE